MNPPRHNGYVGWLICAATIVGWDALAIKTRRHQTMSEAAWRFGDNPAGRSLIVAVCVAVTSHLLWEPRWR